MRWMALFVSLMLAVPATALAQGVCGNTVLEGSEECDDGNTDDGDCCSSSCQFESRVTVCRARAGSCDLVETCTGSSATCPADAKSTAQCRAAADVCDVAESCDGVGDACPADVVAPATTICNPGSGDLCDPDEFCSGTAGEGCPMDTIAPVSTVCRTGSGDLCDPPEFCTGIADRTCPIDVVARPNTICNSGSGDVCDPDEFCSGTAGEACPTDTIASSSTVCRAGSGDPCDPPETCTGVADAMCPADGFKASGVACGDPSDTACSNPDTCDGAGACDPRDEPDGTSCDDLDMCTIEDECQGGSCLVNPNSCGDGILQQSCGEECDDGNMLDGDDCSSLCLIEMTDLDIDSDGVLDADDNCPTIPNGPDQQGVLGVGNQTDTDDDGIGDACECGDVNDDGIVDHDDVLDFRLYLTDPNGMGMSLIAESRCSVIEDAGPCEILDVTVLRRALATPSLSPGLRPVCDGANAP